MKLGLCCISEILKQKSVSFRTMTRKSFLSKPRGESEAKLHGIIENNLSVLTQIIEHCANIGISHYRLSSSMFPLIGDPVLNLSFHEFCSSYSTDLKIIGDRIRELGLTVSSHPAQYTVLPSLNPQTVQLALFDLETHAWLHDSLGFPPDKTNPINIHVGLSKGEPEDISNRFYAAYNKLSNNVRSRLVLENDDKGAWSPKMLLQHFTGFTFTFDNLHYIAQGGEKKDLEYWMGEFGKTWGDFTPIFHWSEGGAGGKPRSHVDYFSEIPQYVLDNRDIIFEAEVKAKDLAILKILTDLKEAA